MELKIRELSEKGLSCREVAGILGTSPSTVSRVLRGYKKKKPIKDDVIAMRLKGVMINDIANRFNISVPTVAKYLKGISLPNTTSYEVTELANKGYTRFGIALLTGLEYQTVYKNSRDIEVAEFVDEDLQLAKCLRMDGYSIREVMNIMCVSYSYVKNATKGMKIGYYSLKPKPTRVQKKVEPKKIIKVMKKKKIDKKPTQMEQRAMLSKGVEAGVYTTDVVMREDRDEGRLVKLLYSDLDDTPRVPISIRVRDTSISDEEAVERWKVKFKKKSVKLVK